MLAQSVVREFAGKARFVSENYGGSALAKRFGVTRYPAIFVNDVLVATPKDFGFYGKGEGAGDGRYTPLKSADAHERFRSDLSRSIRLVLEGRKDAARAAAPSPTGGEVAAFPDVVLTDLEGRPISRRHLAGRAVLVEFWATWCPPCRGTLGWLGEVKKRYGERLTVIAVAIESDESAVRKVALERELPLRWTMGTPDVARAFGDVSGVPTLLLFDGAGKAAAAFYGAPPDLHSRAETKLAAVIQPLP
ncbi:MAG TPA: TlpA disulfide reductase family protein [Thermoanaerobaculia bacterium]